MPFTNQSIDGRYPYVMRLSDIPQETKDKAMKFALATENDMAHIYPSFSREERLEHIYYGKMGEEVFAQMMRDQYGLDLPVDYRVYPGFCSDDCDFRIEDITIDVKISFLKDREGDKRSDETKIRQAQERFNFMFPQQQGDKDVLVFGLLDSKKETIVLTSWTTIGILENNCTIVKQDNKDVRKMPFSKGFDLKQFGILSRDLTLLESIHQYFSPEIIDVILKDDRTEEEKAWNPYLQPNIFHKIFISQTGSMEEYEKFRQFYQEIGDHDPTLLSCEDHNLLQITDYDGKILDEPLDPKKAIKIESRVDPSFYKNRYSDAR